MVRVTKIQTLSLPPEMAEQIKKLAKEENMTKSELFREAIRQYLRRKRWEKIREYGAKKAAELGIKGEDVERLIDEYRSEKKRK
jgi:metal-responsive CopG/Arc/MetJ family transcriptional regulator